MSEECENCMFRELCSEMMNTDVEEKKDNDV